MTWFLYFACVLTGSLCGGAFGYLLGFLFFSKQPPLPLYCGFAGAILGTVVLIFLGRKLQRIMNEK
jgi:membrane protein YqaA with SNARE-associated domain